MTFRENADRFAGKAQDYQEYRPRYPRKILELLANECGVTRNSTIADIASGTGLCAEIFLENGNPLTAVEPNGEMRAICSLLCRKYPNLKVMDGTAESTGLASASVDLLTAAQAMHWFDLSAAKKEFSRILRSGGWCVVVYNERRMGGDRFHDGYEDLMVSYGIDYQLLRKQTVEESKLRAFFSPARMLRHSLPNLQRLDLEALLGRVVSSSYMPGPGHPRFPSLLEAVERLFRKNQTNGTVDLEYECVISCGQLSHASDLAPER